MTIAQLSLDDAITAGHTAAEDCASHADADWLAAARWQIRALADGERVLAEHIAERVAARGYTTSDQRALDHVIQEAKRDGLIVADGFGRAKTSHGSPKVIWKAVKP